MLTFSSSTQGTGWPASLDARSSRNTCRTSPVLCSQANQMTEGDSSGYAASHRHCVAMVTT